MPQNQEICNNQMQPRSLPFKGQVTEQTTVKWSIESFYCFNFNSGFSTHFF